MSALIALIDEWLPAQRWYAGKGRPVDEVAIETRIDLGSLDDAAVVDLVVAVDHGGDIIRYQVPLTLRKEPSDALTFALIGECDEGFVHDGLADPAGARTWLAAMLDGHADVTQRTVAQFHHDSGTLAPDLPSRVVGAEQSNTSVIYGEDAILKVFRRLAPGLNPDLEVTQALAKVGSPHVPAALGHITGPVADIDTTLALMQRFLPHATDGWKLATTSVRDLFAEADLHADEVGGDFASEAERIGRATAEVHDALAQVLPTDVDGPEQIDATVQMMHRRLDDALAEVAELAPFGDALHAAYDAVLAAASKVPVQRIHGDLHLGQLLRVDSGWNLVDFEGEPARPLTDRVRLMTPLRDVAGMLRSFDYAARSLLADHQGERSLAFRADEWADRNRDAFCAGYAASSGTDPRDSAALLNACEIDKAVYEVLYEVRHRPSWISIPLAGLARITGREEISM
ncbi:MAG TPA: hypothetical protein VHE83_11465 [Mycobacteriales bacterium]|nr:hypothetical protein [Mycobacteriales bacterium]